MVEPYKSEILPHLRFNAVAEAEKPTKRPCTRVSHSSRLESPYLLIHINDLRHARGIAA